MARHFSQVEHAGDELGVLRSEYTIAVNDHGVLGGAKHSRRLLYCILVQAGRFHSLG